MTTIRSVKLYQPHFSPRSLRCCHPSYARMLQRRTMDTTWGTGGDDSSSAPLLRSADSATLAFHHPARRRLFPTGDISTKRSIIMKVYQRLASACAAEGMK